MTLSTETRLKINRDHADIMRARIESDQHVLDELNRRIAELEEAEQQEKLGLMSDLTWTQDWKNFTKTE